MSDHVQTDDIFYNFRDGLGENTNLDRWSQSQAQAHAPLTVIRSFRPVRTKYKDNKMNIKIAFILSPL